MAIIDDQFQKATLRKKATKNLQRSLWAFVFLIVASLSAFTGLDSFYPGHNDTISLVFMVLFVILMSLAAFIAMYNLLNTLIALKTSGDSRNYFAIGIAVLVLFLIGISIMKRV